MILKLLIVTYNAEIELSPVISSALGYGLEPSDIYISDNSTLESFKKSNLNFCNENGLVYIDNHGNVGLSVAYNNVILLLRDINYDALIIFDQDTEVPNNYFSSVIQSLIDYPDILIHAPYVESPTVYMSPRIFKRHRIVRWKAPNSLPQYGLCCINSGLVLRKSLFDIVGVYDPSIFLDYVDHEFFQRVRKMNLAIKIIDVKLNQNFSGEAYSNLNGDINRYRIYVKDIRRYAELHNISRIYINFLLAWKCAALTKHYRILQPLKIFFGLK